MVHIYNGILFNHKKKERVPFAAILVDLVIIIVSKVSQTGKDKYLAILLICGIKNDDTNDLTYKSEIVSQI